LTDKAILIPLRG